MEMSEQQYREDIIRVCRLVYEKGWVAMNDGNISIRLDDKRILCTPTAISKGFVQADDLIICDNGGDRLEGTRQRTSEIAMHTTIYSLRPDVRAVVHAHPPVATGFATAGRALDKALLPEVVIQLGAVPLATYGLPGTPALTAGMIPLIPITTHSCFRITAALHTARICGMPISKWRWLSTLPVSRWLVSCSVERNRYRGTSKEVVRRPPALQRVFQGTDGAGFTDRCRGRLRVTALSTGLVHPETPVRTTAMIFLARPYGFTHPLGAAVSSRRQ